MEKIKMEEEKEKILQEKLDEIFKEFEAFTSRDLQSIFKSGKTRGGKNIESSSMGELDPEIAKSLAKAFKEGIKLLPQILELLPDLLKKFDKDLTKEAKERLEKKMEEDKKSEKEKTTKPEEQKPKDESEISENKPLEKNIKQDPLHSKIKKPAA